jgi:uncharacterized membrane protein YfcA
VLDTLDYVIIFLLGSVGGFLSGFLGVGGGIVYIPILDYYLSKMGLQNDDLVKAILANSLFTIIFSGSVSSYKQYKLGNFYPKEILLTAIPGVVTALVMTMLIKSGTWYNKEIFNVVFACMLLVVALRMLLAKPQTTIETTPVKAIGYNLTGFFAGIITAMSGLGGGVVMTPIFTDVMKQDIKKASSISNGVIPVFAIAVGVLNLSSTFHQQVSTWQLGYIVFPVVLPMIAATFVFAPLGVRASQSAPQQLVRAIFATFVSMVFIKTLYAILFY